MVSEVPYYAYSLPAVYYGKYPSLAFGCALQAHSSKIPLIVPYPSVPLTSKALAAAYNSRAAIVLQYPIDRFI